METKFIEGTNEQYSIREDGVVIKNYKTRGKKKFYIESTLQGSKDPKGNTLQFRLNNKTYSKNALLIKYFGYKDCKNTGCTNKIDILHVLYCKKCAIELNKKVLKNFRTVHADKIRKYKKEKCKKDVETISKSYVASALLGIKISEMNDELYQSQKKIIILKRKIAREHNMNINSLK
jgi:hypothetical protein